MTTFSLAAPYTSKLHSDIIALNLKQPRKFEFTEKTANIYWDTIDCIVHVYPHVRDLDLGTGDETQHSRFSYGPHDGNLTYTNSHADVIAYLMETLKESSPSEEEL